MKIKSLLISNFFLFAASNAWAGVNTCPTPPTIDPVTITHNFNGAQSVQLRANSSSSYYPPGLNTQIFQRNITIYKQPYGSESQDTLPNGNLGKVVSYQLSAIGGNAVIGTDNYNYFYPTLSLGLPAWKGTPDPLPYATNIQIIERYRPSNVNFVMSIPFQNAPPAGTSTIEFILYAFYSDGPFNTCSNLYPSVNTSIPRSTIAWGKQTVNYYVPSAASISMTGGSTNGSINFNDTNGLKTGEKKSVTLNLNSNQKYKVIMDSAFNGYLNLNNAVGATEKVAYTATLDNETISESTPYQTTVGTSGSTVSKSFEVTIGNTDNARAGWYKDTITLTISPY